MKDENMNSSNKVFRIASNKFLDRKLQARFDVAYVADGAVSSTAFDVGLVPFEALWPRYRKTSLRAFVYGLRMHLQKLHSARQLGLPVGWAPATGYLTTYGSLDTAWV
ncbi:hypothetical protein EVAR_28522_1 [Eumeta japonica]|uniref:Uncharacterized protein n=1 Tax=Eumeta variegata TaxID=151549 RepID=A0A4C1WS83_EUMVA|nr:hypothetical protein EVAR_28522_1 [Eumeta japonica]